MRIITGIYKGRRFDIPRSFKARPTTDFAKENIFNVLNSYIDFEGLRALDLFAGTGSISLELLSRGCSQVVSVEADRDHARFIGECVRKLGVTNHQLIRGDVFRYLKSAQKSSTLTRGSAALPAAQQPYTAEGPYTPQSDHARGSAALPAAQQPYTAEGPYTPQSGHARGSAALNGRRPYALCNCTMRSKGMPFTRVTGARLNSAEGLMV